MSANPYTHTKVEIQSGLDRVQFAEGLIRQLSSDHDGRNTWLMNYGTSDEAKQLRDKRNLVFNPATRSAVEINEEAERLVNL